MKYQPLSFKTSPKFMKYQSLSSISLGKSPSFPLPSLPLPSSLLPPPDRGLDLESSRLKSSNVEHVEMLKYGKV